MEPNTHPPEARARPSSNSNRPFAALEHESIASSSTRDLFDPSRPRYPRRDVLIHLSELFVKLFRTNLCPWVREKELLDGARNASLPSILANSICAMTARFSDWAELRRKTPKNAGEPFSEMAKTLIVPMLSWPSLDVIEALIPGLREVPFLWLLTDRRAVIVLFILGVSWPLSLYRDIAKV